MSSLRELLPTLALKVIFYKLLDRLELRNAKRTHLNERLFVNFLSLHNLTLKDDRVYAEF